MLAALLAACDGGGIGGDAVDPAASAAATKPLGFEVWHADFPGAPEIPYLSPRQPGRWYDRTPRQALESIAAKLQGNCSRDAWLMAKDFFSRIDPEDADVLVTTLDRAMQANDQTDLAENVVDAIGRARAPQAADALLRALEHQRMSIRNKAMIALRGSGTAEAVMTARRMFPVVDGRGIEGWIRAAREHLPPETLVTEYQRILADPQLEPSRTFVVENALALPPSQALDVFRQWIGHEPASVYATICGLRHAVGDSGGTVLLIDLLKRSEPQQRLAALQALRFGGAEELLDRILPLTNDPDPQVRLAVVGVLAPIRLETVGRALETMSIDESQDVRRAAMRELVVRGRRQVIDDLIDTVRSGTGSRLRLALEDLIAIRDGAAVPAMVERMAVMPEIEKRDMLRAISLTTAAEAFAPLREVFVGEDAFAAENRSYISYLMINCRGAEHQVLELFESLPKADYERRGLILGTLSAVAADREEPELSAAVHALLRRLLFDRDEIPQMRLSALGHLRRDLRLDDMRSISDLARDEEPSMRKALTDFLFEFY